MFICLCSSLPLSAWEGEKQRPYSDQDLVWSYSDDVSAKRNHQQSLRKPAPNVISNKWCFAGALADARHRDVYLRCCRSSVVALQRWTETVVDHRPRLLVELKSAASHFWIALPHGWPSLANTAVRWTRASTDSAPHAAVGDLTAFDSRAGLEEIDGRIQSLFGYHHNGWAAAASPAAGLCTIASLAVR